MAWSPQQDIALKKVEVWFREYKLKRGKGVKQYFYLAGFAGVGKTTLAKHFAENVNGDVAFGAFSGKAANVMRKKGCIGARTIHSLMYVADVDNETGEVHFRLNKAQSDLNNVDLLIIDECSMVDDMIAGDLLSFNKPILVLGDPAQLPPIGGAGYFTSGEPDMMLTEIHRQAADNPIIYLATQARQEIMPDLGEYGDSKIVSKISSQEALDADQIIVGRNATRDDLNRRMRKLLKLEADIPVVNDKLICLKNDRDLGIFNGGMFTVQQMITSKYKTNFLHMRLQSDDEDAMPTLVKVHKSFFSSEVGVPDWKLLKGSQQFDFGYCISAHKAQGSEWRHVLAYDESYCFREDRFKWLYTVLTRAETKITLVRN